MADFNIVFDNSHSFRVVKIMNKAFSDYDIGYGLGS
jgi:hypothetical protein